MRSARTVFWVSIIVLAVSIIFICVSSCLKGCYQVWDIVLNIFVSLAGGAFLSAVTSIISFFQTQKDHEIKFNSHVIRLNNILLKLLTWYDFDYDTINYTKQIDSSVLTVEQLDEAQRLVFGKMNQSVRSFVSLVRSFTEYNYDEMIYILDDYRGLFENKTHKIKKIMIGIRNELNKFNITYYQEMLGCLQIYDMGKYPESAVYNGIVNPYLQKTNIREERFDQLFKLRKTYLDLTGLVEYTKKQQ